MDDFSRLRPLCLLQILHEQTDEDHPLSTSALIRALEERYGIEAYRTTISRDVALLCRFGVDICTRRSTQNHYFLAGRLFELPELKLLLDAVESSKFITEKKSGELVKKLLRIASRKQAEALQKTLFSPEGGKQENEKVYYIVDALSEAIARGRMVSFSYFQYDEHKQKRLKHDGEEYLLSPYRLVWNDDHYYIFGYSEKHRSIGSFRVDRIFKRPRILETPIRPLPPGFDLSSHIRSMFRMFEGEREKVVLLCQREFMDEMVDHFGEEVEASPLGDGRVRVEAQVALTPIFYRWVFGFGGSVAIAAPERAKIGYAALVRKALDSLNP